MLLCVVQKRVFKNSRQETDLERETFHVLKEKKEKEMAATKRSSFRRMGSIGEMFKVRKNKGYRQWEDDGEESLLTNSEPALLGGAPANQFKEDDPDFDDSLEPRSSEGGAWVTEILAECFYLGSYDMAGLGIRGRGCIDYPAGYVWQQTQQSEASSSGGLHKPRRKNSWSPRQKYESSCQTPQSSSVGGAYKTRYVKLMADREELALLDNNTGEKFNSFNYRKISFVGTHPKYLRLFAFVAESADKKVFCHAFKCESKEAADKTACGLSDVFQRKVKEIQAKKQTIEITASATLVD